MGAGRHVTRDLTRRPLTAAERQARRRERVRDGKRRIVLELDEAMVEDVLLRAGILARVDADDPHEVDAAFCEAVEAWASEQIESRVTPGDSEVCDGRGHDHHRPQHRTR